jgi:hypothetical protein
MTVWVKTKDGQAMQWQYKASGAVDKLVAALKENVPNLAEIQIIITRGEEKLNG